MHEDQFAFTMSQSIGPRWYLQCRKYKKWRNNSPRLDVHDTSLTGITNSACPAYIPDAFHLWIYNEVSRKTELDVWKPFVRGEKERFSLVEAHVVLVDACQPFRHRSSSLLARALRFCH